MSQKLEITLVFESESVQYYTGDIVDGVIPVLVGTANIQLKLDNRSDLKVEFLRLQWHDGVQPPFIQDARVSPLLIVIRDENEKKEQRGLFSFLPILGVVETLDAVGRGSARAQREIEGPDPTIINTDIPGGTAGRVRRVA